MVKIISSNNQIEWDNYFIKLPRYKQDIYFTFQYHLVESNYKSCNFECFIYEDNGEMVFYPYLVYEIKRYGYELPNSYYDIESVYGYSGYISTDEDLELISRFRKKFEYYCQEKNIVAEFIRFHPLINQSINDNNNSIELLKDRHTVDIELSNYDDIWNNTYSSNCRNMINKFRNSEDYKTKIIQNPSDNDIKDFIKLYYHNMDHVHASKEYYFNEKYFFDLFKFLKNNILLINIYKSSQDILTNTAIFFYNDTYLHYHLSARIVGSNNFLNNVLIDQSVKFGLENNIKKLHLGGGRTNANDDSLLKFKLNFSKSTNNFMIGKKVHNNQIYLELCNIWEAKYNYKSNNLLKYKLI